MYVPQTKDIKMKAYPHILGTENTFFTFMESAKTFGFAYLNYKNNLMTPCERKKKKMILTIRIHILLSFIIYLFLLETVI